LPHCSRHRYRERLQHQLNDANTHQKLQMNILTMNRASVCLARLRLGLAGTLATALFVATSLEAAPNGAVGDTNIKYLGRWDFSNGSQYMSCWGGAYIKVNFSGTSVKLKVGNTSHYYAKIDGGPWTSYLNASGTVNLTPSPLPSGTHTLSVAQGKDYDYVFNFQGLILDAGAVTSPPAVAADLIEFIGDSITTGYTDAQANVSDYAWICSEGLNSEHTQIAYPGIALVTGYGYNSDKTGMGSQYFKLQPLGYTSPPNWDFTKYTAKLVVVNIGQNDAGNTDSLFQSTYTTFLANVRAKFPNAEIFVMRTFSGTRSAPTLASVNARNAAGDSKVHYIDTAGWLVSGDYVDGVHPSVSGQIKAANLLRPILASYLSSGSGPVANGTYKIIARHSGKGLDALNQGTANGTQIEQWTYWGGAGQKWTVTDRGSNQKSIIGVQSGRAIEVSNWGTANDTKVQLWDWANGTNQKYTFTATSGGYYRITPVHATGSCLDVAGVSTADGAFVHLWTYGGANNQQWAFQAP
jgi:hypothetical protein